MWEKDGTSRYKYKVLIHLSSTALSRGTSQEFLGDQQN